MIGNFDRERESVIVGGGISGLILGHYLKKQRLPFKIYEKNRLGGLIQSKLYPQGRAETAANAILASDDVLELLQDLDLPYVLATPKLKRWIYRDRPRRFPLSVSEIIKILFSLPKKIPAKIETLSVTEALTPLCGKKVCAEVLTTGLQGIYASSAEELHFASLFSAPQKSVSYWSFFKAMIKEKKAKKKKSKGLGSLCFENGMEDLIRALEKELKDHLVMAPAPLPTDQANFFLCTNASGAANLLPPSLAPLLRDIPYRAIKVATLFLEKPIPLLEKSFGILFSAQAGMKSYGLLNNGAIFPGSTKPGFYSYNFILEGSLDGAEAVSHDLFALAAVKLSELPHQVHFHSWPQGIPIYNLQRFQLMQKVSAELSKQKGLLLFGNYTGALSIRELISTAKKFAANL